MAEKPRKRRKRRISIDSFDESTSPSGEILDLIDSPAETSRVRRRRRSNQTDESSISITSSESSSHLSTSDHKASTIDNSMTQLSAAEIITEEKLRGTYSLKNSPTSDSDSFLIDERKITNPSLINAIDKIRAEFAEDKRFTSKQKYWDETHNWGSEE